MDAISVDTFRNTPYVYQFHATGQAYHAWYEVSLATDASIYLEARQAGSNLVHVLDYALKSQATNISLAVYKGATYTGGTTRMNWSPYNHNINKSPTLELYIDPTNVDLEGSTQTFKTKGYGPAQGGQVTFSSAGGASFLEEMYDTEDDYLIEITNHSGSTREFFLNMLWYESGN